MAAASARPFLTRASLDGHGPLAEGKASQGLPTAEYWPYWSQLTVAARPSTAKTALFWQVLHSRHAQKGANRLNRGLLPRKLRIGHDAQRMLLQDRHAPVNACWDLESLGQRLCDWALTESLLPWELRQRWWHAQQPSEGLPHKALSLPDSCKPLDRQKGQEAFLWRAQRCVGGLPGLGRRIL